jgi:transcriptional regulator with XRE-family HTH domain
VGRSKPSAKPLRNVVSAEIRRERLAQGISQDELAARLQRYGWDVGRTTITKIELGERCVTDFELVALADVLQITVEAMIAAAERKNVVRMLNDLDR